MLALIIIGAVLLLLFLLTLAPVRLEIRFHQEFSLTVRYLFLRFPVIPGKEKPVDESAEEGEAEEGVTGKLKDIFQNKGFFGFIKSLFELVKLLESSSRKLFSHVRLRRFDLYLRLSGGDDAAGAAVLYGELSAAVYTACGFLLGLMPCRKKAVTVDLDYQSAESTVDFWGKASIKPLFVLKEAAVLLVKGLPLLKNLKGTNTDPKERISQTRKQGEQHE